MTAVRRVHYRAVRFGEATDQAARQLSARAHGSPKTCQIMRSDDPDWRPGMRFNLEEIETGLQVGHVWPDGMEYSRGGRLYRIERGTIVETTE